VLEDRTLLSFAVTTTLDSGPGSLRQALLDANANPGLDTITFRIGTGAQAIRPATELPAITDPVVLDGTTQPGFAGTPLIELNGSRVGEAAGLTITAGQSTVRGLAINRFGGVGIHLLTGRGNTVVGNYIGTDPTGTVPLGNQGGGVFVEDSTDNRIGGTAAGAGNVISANDGSGIVLTAGAADNRVQGNFIGTDRTGTRKLGNVSMGVFLWGATNNIIGGPTTAERNVIAGNGRNGIQVSLQGGRGGGNVFQGNYVGTDVTGAIDLGNGLGGVFVETADNALTGNVIAGNEESGVLLAAGAAGNRVQGNFIGTDATGGQPLGNGGRGVAILSGTNNLIGGPAPGEGNVIAHNGRGGVYVTAGAGNAILANAVFANTGLGIDLDANGVTPNDPGDGDGGSNNRQNYPILTAVNSFAGSTTIQGILRSTPQTTFRLEFFANGVVNLSYHGDAEKFLGASSVRTDAAGEAFFTLTFAAALPPSAYVSVTGTDPGNNTSEFSLSRAVTAVPALTAVSQALLGGAGSETATGIAVVPGLTGHDVYVSGWSSTAGDESLLAKYSKPYGAHEVLQEWSTSWPGAAGADRFHGVAAVGGAIFAAGLSHAQTTDTTGAKEFKGLTARYATDGSLEWVRQTPAAPGAFAYGGFESLFDVTTAIEGDELFLYVTGQAQGGAANSGRLFVTKLDAAGNVLWTRTDPAGVPSSTGRSVVAQRGIVYVAGQSHDSGAGRAYLVSYFQEGTRAWAHTSVVGTLYSMTVDQRGGAIYAVGQTGGASADFLIEKRDLDGNLLWSQAYDRQGAEDILRGVALVNGRLYAVGSTRGGTAGGSDGVVLELDPSTGTLLNTTLWGGPADDAFGDVAALGTELHVAGTTSSLGAGGSDLVYLVYVVPAPPLEFPVNTTTAGVQRHPEIALDADGDSVVVWVSEGQDGEGAGVYAQRYDATGAAQGGEFRVNTTTAAHQQQPRVAMDADGDFVVVWTGTGPGDAEGIFAQAYDAAGNARGGEFRVNTTTAGSQRDPAVALDADGDFVVVWTSVGQDGDGGGIYGRRYSAELTARGGEFRINTRTGGHQEAPRVALDAAGDFVVVWTSQGSDGSGAGVAARRYRANGTALGSEFRVNTTTAGTQEAPSVSLDADGDFVVAWHGNGTGDSAGIFAQRYNASAVRQGSQFRVNTTTAATQWFPRVALDADGDFVVAWSGFGADIDDQYDIYAQRYDAAGNRRGDEFRVNSYVVGMQHLPALALDADGDFAVAWFGNSRDDGIAVLAQRFEDSGVRFAEAFEGTGLNPFWSLHEVAGSITLPASAPAHGGDRAVQFTTHSTGGERQASLIHPFAKPVFGRVSVWVFDTGADVGSSNSLGLYVSNRGLGVSAGVFAMDSDLGPTDGGEYYYLDFQGATGHGVDRTPGWHLFTIDSTPTAITFAVDGQVLFSRSGGTPFDTVELRMVGSDLRPGWTAYFDDFEVLIETTDTAGPAVADVLVAGKRLEAGGQLTQELSQLVITFAEALSTAGGATGIDSVLNPANWRLTRSGRTISGGIAGITYGLNPVTNKYEATLTFDANGTALGTPPLTDGSYVLTARAALRDLVGNALDGNLDGFPGGDFSRSFRIARPATSGGVPPTDPPEDPALALVPAAGSDPLPGQEVERPVLAREVVDEVYAVGGEDRPSGKLGLVTAAPSVSQTRLANISEELLDRLFAEWGA
jgi:hypothetical protein